MKLRLAVLTGLLCATPVSAQTFGGRAGMTLSSISASEERIEVSSVAGIHAGVTVGFGGERVGLLLSTAYSERGTAFTADELIEDLNFTYRLGYIDVGAFAKIPLGARPYLLAGPTMGFRVGCSASVSGGLGTQSQGCGDQSADPFKRFDFGVSGGAGMIFDAVDFDMVVEALYGFGILNIADAGDDSARNRGLVVRIGVDLGG